MPREIVSGISRKAGAAEPREAAPGMREVTGLDPTTEVPIMVEVIEAAETEIE